MKRIHRSTENTLPTIFRNVSELFACSCAWIIRHTCIIFNTKYSIVFRNNIYKYEDIRRIFTRIKSRTDRQTENINTYQLRWKNKLLQYIYIHCINYEIQLHRRVINTDINNFYFLIFFRGNNMENEIVSYTLKTRK